MIHVFINESFITCALHSFGEEAAYKDGVDEQELYISSANLGELLKKEFLLERTLESKDYFDELIDRLLSKEVFERLENGKIKLHLSSDVPYQFLCSLIWPLIDTYWLAFVYIFSLIPSKFLPEKDMVTKIQWFADTMIKEKVIDHYESCSQETIRNAISIF